VLLQPHWLRYLSLIALPHPQHTQLVSALRFFPVCLCFALTLELEGYI
jgi:hypothetical protein